MRVLAPHTLSFPYSLLSFAHATFAGLSLLSARQRECRLHGPDASGRGRRPADLLYGADTGRLSDCDRAKGGRGARRRRECDGDGLREMRIEMRDEAASLLLER